MYVLLGSIAVHPSPTQETVDTVKPKWKDYIHKSLKTIDLQTTLPPVGPIKSAIKKKPEISHNKQMSV